MIAVQAGDVFLTEQLERLLRAWTKIHLIAQREDHIRRMAPDCLHNRFERDDVGMNVGDEGNTHSGDLLAEN